MAACALCVRDGTRRTRSPHIVSHISTRSSRAQFTVRLSLSWFSLVVASGNFLFQILGCYPTTNQMKTTWNLQLFQRACAITAPLQRVTPKFTRASHHYRQFMITTTCAKGLRRRSRILSHILLQEVNLDVLHLLD